MMIQKISWPSPAGTARFVVLAVIAALAGQTWAQTIDGLDLAVIKARGAGEVADAQTFVDAISARGDVYQPTAEELRNSGSAAVRAIDAASLPKGPAGPVDFDELLAGATANTQAPMGEGPLFVVFASLSMPQASLSALIRDTTKAGGVVLFRGFPNNSARSFAEGLKRVVSDEAQESHIAIDPRLFRAFNVTAAPTFVVTGRAYELCDGLKCSSLPPDHDRMMGNVTVEYALESFANTRGPGAGVANIALGHLRGRR